MSFFSLIFNDLRTFSKRIYATTTTTTTTNNNNNNNSKVIIMITCNITERQLTETLFTPGENTGNTHSSSVDLMKLSHLFVAGDMI